MREEHRVRVQTAPGKLEEGEKRALTLVRTKVKRLEARAGKAEKGKGKRNNDTQLSIKDFIKIQKSVTTQEVGTSLKTEPNLQTTRGRIELRARRMGLKAKASGPSSTAPA